MSNFLKTIKNKIGIDLNDNKKRECNSNSEVFSEYLNKYKDSFKGNNYDINVSNDEVIIEGNGMKIIGKSINTFWTAEDVLCKGDYDFNSDDDYIMIDIGLNIGITTLKMSTLDNIKKIYGYEPFLPTFIQAQKNMKLNPILSKKIEIFNFGLGNEDKLVDVNYNPDLPGAMSSVRNKFPDSSKVEKIKIKKASDVLSEIINNAKELIFLKIDCEGAEGEILEDLNKNGLLKKIDLIILEWHYEHPIGIINILKNNNFIFFNSETIKNELGFIRAVNKKKI